MEERTVMEETTDATGNLNQGTDGEEVEEGLPFIVYGIAFGCGILIVKGAKAIFNLVTGKNKKYAEVDHGKFTRVK